MGLFSQLKQDTPTNLAPEKDTLGGGSRILDSDIYLFTVVEAYILNSSGGAMGLRLKLKADAGELRQDVYFTSGTAKGCKTYYEDKQGNKNPLPGFSLVEALSLMTTGKHFLDLEGDIEKKFTKAWDKNAKAEVPQEVQMVIPLIGKQVWGAVLKTLEDKNQLNQATNQYEPTGETREANELDKFFHAESKLTVAEATAGATAAVFFDQWLGQNKGKVKDKSTKVTGNATPGARPGPAAGGTPTMFGGAAAKPNGAGGRPTSSLFGGPSA